MAGLYHDEERVQRFHNTSALKFYNAVIQSTSVMVSLYLMNIKDMQSFSIFSWEQRIKIHVQQQVTY